MKHSVISLLLALICTLCINSCTEENNSSHGKNVTKRIELTFTGEMDNISPWARFSIYTEDNGSFKYISDGDTTTVNNGLFQSDSHDFYKQKIVFERDYKYFVYDFHLAVTYLKRTSNPTEADILKVNIKAFKNNQLVKEENRVMRSYEISERPSSDEYIYRFTF